VVLENSQLYFGCQGLFEVELLNLFAAIPLQVFDSVDYPEPLFALIILHEIYY